ncbi:hypothetical protein LCGC14_2689280, partial [marine sediment metagenome]
MARDDSQQRNSKDFVNFIKKLFPNMPMSTATRVLAKDLDESIT